MDWNEDIILEGQWTQHSISSDPQSFTSHFFLTQRCICFIWYPNSMPFIYSWGHLYHSTTKAIRSRVLIWHFHSAFDEINLIFDHIYLNGDGPTSQESLGVSFICLCIPDIPVFAAFQENFRHVQEDRKLSLFQKVLGAYIVLCKFECYSFKGHCCNRTTLIQLKSIAHAFNRVSGKV